MLVVKLLASILYNFRIFRFSYVLYPLIMFRIMLHRPSCLLMGLLNGGSRCCAGVRFWGKSELGEGNCMYFFLAQRASA